MASSENYITEMFAEEKAIPISTPMRDYYRGKTILLTGATGFLGQLYLEKILRSDVKCLYVLTRPKKGVPIEKRIEEIFCGVLFNKLIRQDKKSFKKIKIIEGDMAKLQLALSEKDRMELEENVEIIIHAAANVRFDEKLRNLLITNLRGTRELLKIAENMKKLQVTAYISTAYSHCYRHDIDEKFYPPAIDPDVMINFAEKFTDMTDERLEILTALIIKPWPNTYTYTKALSEELVRRFGQKRPICIIRPSIVISTHEDPIPGWCNNIYGLNGVLVACGMGVMRILPYKDNVIGDIVCADFVINSTLAAIWVTYEDTKFNQQGVKSYVGSDPEIYHVCSYVDRPVTYNQIQEDTARIFAKYPAKRMLWKHCPNAASGPLIFQIFTIYYHVIPGIFFDLYLSFKKEKVRLMPVYRKVQRFLIALKYFMVNQYRFTNDNMKRVLARMSPDDAEFFPADVRRYNWENFVFDYVTGLKKFIGYENLNDLEVARKRYVKLCIMHFIVKCFYYGIHTYIYYKILCFYGFFEYCANSISDVYNALNA